MNAPLMARIYPRLMWQPSDCWLWTGPPTTAGYAYIESRPYGRHYVHRYVYEAFIGPIPEGFQVDHLCRVRMCANPQHLEAVTQRENIRRSSAPNAIAARTNRCARGHSLIDEGYVRPDGKGRICRACARVRDRARYARKVAQR